MGNALQKEIETFQARKKELLAEAEGKFVLIKGEEVAGVFDSQGDALQGGYKRFGKDPFLVKKVLAVDLPLPFTSNVVGV
jgi:hypothetical protein